MNKFIVYVRYSFGEVCRLHSFKTEQEATDWVARSKRSLSQGAEFFVKEVK